MKQLKAAVENGADAVYMGGKRFNARVNADNFENEEMKEAIDYADLRGVRLCPLFGRSGCTDCTGFGICCAGAEAHPRVCPSFVDPGNRL